MSLPVGAFASKSREITAANWSSVSSTEKSSAPSTVAGNTSRPCRLMTNGFTPTSPMSHLAPSEPGRGAPATRFPLSGTGTGSAGVAVPARTTNRLDDASSPQEPPVERLVEAPVRSPQVVGGPTVRQQRDRQHRVEQQVSHHGDGQQELVDGWVLVVRRELVGHR